MGGEDVSRTTIELLATATNPAEIDQLDSVITSLAGRLRIKRDKDNTVEIEGEEKEISFTERVVDEEDFKQILEYLRSQQGGTATPVRKQTVQVVGRLIDTLMTPSSIAFSYQDKPAVNELIPLLATGLFDASETVRREAAEQLSLVARTHEAPLGPKITSETPVYLIMDDLRRALSAEDVTDVRATVVEALHRLSTERPSAVESAIPELCDASKNSEGSVRNPATAALANIFRFDRVDYRNHILPYTLTPSSPDAETAIHRMSELLVHSDTDTRERAATGIANAAYHTPATIDPVVPELCRALQATENNVKQTLTRAVAYLSRAHPLLALPTLPAFDGRVSDAYVRGALKNVRDSYPHANKLEVYSNDFDHPGSEVTEELLLNRDQAVQALRNVLGEPENEASLSPHSDLLNTLCSQLLDFSDHRTTVFACEALALSAYRSMEVTERACKMLIELANDSHYIDTAPRMSIYVIRQHQPSAVDSALEDNKFELEECSVVGNFTYN